MTEATGSVKANVPDQIATYHFMKTVLNEMNVLVRQLKPKSTKLIFQSLPKHMRRRAMSHNPKRLPTKFRSIHISQMSKSGAPNKRKRPSRKYRRRPRNLRSEYARRMRKISWLETHIWYAKRFHMINRWGYRLPYRSCDKTYRACRKAISRSCLLQDVSYFVCLELRGPADRLNAGFKRIICPHGLSMNALTYRSGLREGSVTFYKADKYPFGALGVVNYMWKPVTSTESDNYRTIWIWVHPSIYNTLLMEMIALFELKVIKGQPSVDIEDQALKTSEAIYRKRCYGNAEHSLRLTVLKDVLNRFRLTGPRADAVVKSVLVPRTLENFEPAKDWVDRHMENESEARELFQQQNNFWQSIQNVSNYNLRSNGIVALNVIDPRLVLSGKKQTRNVDEMEEQTLGFECQGQQDCDTVSLPKPYSCLWDEKCRTSISAQKEITKSCENKKKLQPIPVILIQRPGVNPNPEGANNFGGGWDIIMPHGYGMPFWMAFVMQRIRVGGLREDETLARESCVESCCPDTLMGRILGGERYNNLREKYFNLPPNKRCNYQKLAIASPFRIPYQQLLRDWNGVPGESGTKFTEFYVQRGTINTTTSATAHNCLIQVQVRLMTRGCKGDFALICLPTPQDREMMLMQRRYTEKTPVHFERRHLDTAEGTRKQARQEHRKLLKRLRARRVRAKRRAQETCTRRVRIAPANTAALVRTYNERMRTLWLAHDAQNFATPFCIRNQCDREVAGYISALGFTYTRGHGVGIGYIAAAAYERVMQLSINTISSTNRKYNNTRSSNNPTCMCLIRATNSTAYRLATLRRIPDVV